MKGLDLSRLKKVSSDEKSTTFKHANGHVLKIAHSALSPKMRGELEKLPMHGQKMAKGGAVKRYADGADVEAPADDDSDDQSQQDQPPVNININSGPQPNPQPTGQQEMGPPATPAQYQPGVSEPGPVATTGLNPNNQVDENEVPPQNRAPAASAPKQTDNIQTSQSSIPNQSDQSFTPADLTKTKDYQDAYNAYKQSHLKQFAQEDAATAHDLTSGHITPETYGDLFSKKDTLGKVGTLFGLLLSGAGSGLSHQPNAVFSMMNNEIQNDLEAQKTSKSNAQNLIRLNQQNEMTKAQVNSLNQESAIKADMYARTQANRIAFHKMVTNVDRLPVGSPQRQQGESVLASMNQAVNSENFDIMDKAASAAALFNLGNQSDQGSNPEQNFQRTQTAMRVGGQEKYAQDREAKHIPGFQGQASESLSPAEKDELTKKANFDKQLGRFTDWAKTHNNTDPADIATVNQGKTLARMLQNSYRESSLGTVFKAAEAPLLNQTIPEEPSKFLNQYRVVPQLETLRKENASQLNDEAVSKGFKGYQSAQASSAPQYKVVNGVKYMRGPNGEAIKAK